MTEQKTALNRFSRRITQPPSQAASQAMLYGAGLDEIDMKNPQVGIASMWWGGKFLQFSPQPSRRIHQAKRERRKENGRPHFQHDRRERRHLNGHRGYEILFAIPGPHRRFDRDRRRSAMV